MTIGTTELIVVAAIGFFIFLFGAGKVKEWVKAFKDVKDEANKS